MTRAGEVQVDFGGQQSRRGKSAPYLSLSASESVSMLSLLFVLQKVAWLIGKLTRNMATQAMPMLSKDMVPWKGFSPFCLQVV